MATSVKTFQKPTKEFITGHLTVFAIAAGLVLVAIILTLLGMKYYRTPGWTLFGIILLSVAFLIFVYNWAYRYDVAPPTVKGGPEWWQFVAACLFYGVIAFSVYSAARTQRVEACIPAHNLSPETSPEKWVQFYQDCPSSQLLIDEPAKDYIINNRKKPYWLMDKDGYTSDPVGWWKYYSVHPKNPYKLTPDVQKELYDTRKLPEHTLKGD